VTYTTTAGDLTSVAIGGIAVPACEGASLNVTVVDASRTSIASGGPVTVPSGSTSVNVPVSPHPPAEAPAGVDVSLVGP
jgi:hypothetical protein